MIIEYSLGVTYGQLEVLQYICQKHKILILRNLIGKHGYKRTGSSDLEAI
jgi:hypothetical protein